MNEPQSEIEFYGGPWDGKSTHQSAESNYYIWAPGIDLGCYVFTVRSGRNYYRWISDNDSTDNLC